MVKVYVEARNDPGNPGYVKMGGETWELNVWATTDDLWKLADIEATDWSQRRLLAVGTCAGVPVWWSEEDGTVNILVGKDHETWASQSRLRLSAAFSQHWGNLRKSPRSPGGPRFSEPPVPGICWTGQTG
jgi:hypothetical protein